MASVRLRTLFDTVHNIVEDGVLILDENGIRLNRLDNTTSMVVFVTLDRLGPNGDGTFFCKERLEVGIDIGEFHEALNAAIQGDVLGVCITKKSWENGMRTIDLYLMSDNGGYSYEYRISALELEYEPVNLRPNTKATQLTIACTQFKRILHDCQKVSSFVSM